MKIKNLSKAVIFRPTIEQEKALKKLEQLDFNRSKIIRIALDEYLHSNFRVLINQNNRKQTPF